RLEPVVAQRPDGVLTGGAGAEVRARHEHGALRVGGTVQHEVGIVRAPGVEQTVVEAGLGDPLEVDGGDDLVGVDVAAAQRDADAGVGGEGFHGGAPGEGGSGDGLEVGGRGVRTEVRRRGQGAAHGGGGGHDRRDQVGAPALSLAALEVAVGG